jgi:hypothetical protein
MFIATLRCGTVLTYEARSFLPTSGERVPCRSHGYCGVHVVGTTTGPAIAGPPLPRARPRTQRELEAWLRERPTTTVHALKRERFTLRMIAAAEREGRVSVDVETGRVRVR